MNTIRFRRSLLALAWLSVGVASTAAQAATATQFDIPASPLTEALQRFAQQSGARIDIAGASLQGTNAKALSGSYAPEEALKALLAGTGLSFKTGADGSFVIERDRAIALAPVSVEETVRRAQSEGTGNYRAQAATLGKMALAPREIPQSVTVITRQRMDDQGMQTAWDAMTYATGVTAVSNDASQSQYHARGYALGVMYDGMPAYSGLSGYQQYDLVIYDRVEVQRGPAGLVQGSDNPSGVVNFVRKRAQDKKALNATVDMGSWDYYRATLDVTGPLNESGSVRARAIAMWNDRDYFFDRAHDRKWLGYATLDYDLAPSTTFSVAATVQDDDSPTFSGLPAYTNGQFLNVDRSTNVYPDWGKYLWHTEELQANIEHRFDNGWQASVKVLRRNQDFYFKDSYPTTGVDPATLTMTYARREADYHYHRNAVDVFVTGPFELLGRKHAALVGFNYDELQTDYVRGTAPNVTGVPLFHPEVVIEPTVTYTLGGESQTAQHGLYTQARLSLSDAWTTTLGARVTDFQTKSHNKTPATPTNWGEGAHAEQEITPYGAVMYDVLPNTSLYASYSEIFMPQTAQTYDGQTLDPRTGEQYELGVKAGFFDRKLDTTFALFRTHELNRAFADPDHPDYYLPLGKIQVQGYEAEVTGSPMSGLQLSAGFTRLMTKYLKDKNNQGRQVSYWYPPNQLKVWAMYRPAGAWADWRFGAGMVGQGPVRVNGTGTTDVREQSSFAVYDATVGYRINAKMDLTFAVKNLFDRKYYTRMGGLNTYNTYGDPRNVMLTLRARF